MLIFLKPMTWGEIGTLPPDIDTAEKDEMTATENIAIVDEDGLQNDGITEGEDQLKQEKVVYSLKDKVIAENQSAKSKTDKTIDSHEVAVVSKTHDVNYFIEARMDREQKRSEQIEILSECISSETLDKDSKSNAATNLITLQERIEKESGIESLLKAKGFKEVFVRISEDDVDVVINKEKIEEADIAQIEDIVRRKTGYKASQIRISPLKN